jgi:hypothetical protein
MFTEGVDGDCTVIADGVGQAGLILVQTIGTSVFDFTIFDFTIFDLTIFHLAMRLNEPQLLPKRLDKVMWLSDRQN